MKEREFGKRDGDGGEMMVLDLYVGGLPLSLLKLNGTSKCLNIYMKIRILMFL